MEQNIDVVGMSKAEALKAESYIKDKDKMLEWGAGGSTLYFPQLLKTYVSIEHDIKWYDIIKPQIQTNVEFYHIKMNEVIGGGTNWWDDEEEEHSTLINNLENNAFDILRGTDNWYKNYGVTEISEKNGKVYWVNRGEVDWHAGINYIKKPFDLEYRDYDVILVDGRCRAMCAYIAQFLLKEDGYLLFHDFNIREYYHGILTYYNIVDTEETLVVLQKKYI